MSQEPTNKKIVKASIKKKSETMNAAMKLFLAGCFVELYLLLVRRFYVAGTLEEVVAWDGYLNIILYVCLGVLVAGLLLALICLKKTGWLRTLGWWIFGIGAFLAVSNWLIRTYYTTAVTFLCIIVPAIMLMGVLWNLYDRECAWSLTILGADVVALWVCRKGLGSEYWNTKIMIGAIVFLVLLAVASFLTFQTDKHKGMLGTLRVLPADADALPIYVSCGLSAIAIVLAFINTTAAYYAMWAVAVVMFALAVYYTVRQL